MTRATRATAVAPRTLSAARNVRSVQRVRNARRVRNVRDVLGARDARACCVQTRVRNVCNPRNTRARS
eukprot:5126904-Lingulodinium_polyedra.AAC.1